MEIMQRSMHVLLYLHKAKNAGSVFSDPPDELWDHTNT
jgi:hypothetical protein